MIMPKKSMKEEKPLALKAFNKMKEIVNQLEITKKFLDSMDQNLGYIEKKTVEWKAEIKKLRAEIKKLQTENKKLKKEKE
jgi:hypothetical protein